MNFPRSFVRDLFGKKYSQEGKSRKKCNEVCCHKISCKGKGKSTSTKLTTNNNNNNNMKFGYSVVAVIALAFTVEVEGAVRRPREDKNKREVRKLTRSRGSQPKAELRQLKKEEGGGGGGGDDGDCPKFVKNGSVVPEDMQCNNFGDCSAYCATASVVSCCCVATNAFGGGYCGGQFGCNDYGQCLGGGPASTKMEEEVKIYSTPNGEVIETANVKVTVANDGKETIQIASQQKVQNGRPQGTRGSANHKPMGKGSNRCEYKFTVHCNHEDSGGSERYSTTDRITAKIMNNNNNLVDTQTFNGFCQNSGSEDIEGDDCDVRGIDLSTDGDNALLIDYIELYDENGKVDQWGVRDGNAWCLSTDANDNQSYWGDFLEDGRCYSSIRWD